MHDNSDSKENKTIDQINKTAIVKTPVGHMNTCDTITSMHKRDRNEDKKISASKTRLVVAVIVTLEGSALVPCTGTALLR